MSEPITEPDTQSQATPPWGTPDQFDPEKAWNLIQGLRADKDRLSSRPALTAEQETQLREYQALIEASKSDLDRVNDERARWQNDAETWRNTAVAARIEALAAPDFEYPADAVNKLDPAQYLDAGGQINEAAIKADLAALLAERPTWARANPTSQQQPRVPAPNAAQGTSGGRVAADPAQAFAAHLQTQLR